MAWAAKRLATTLILAVGVAVASFVLVYQLPGDPARIVAGTAASAEMVDAIREDLGLVGSLPTQVGRNLWGFLQGDFGTNYQTRRPVLVELSRVFPNSLLLAVVAEGLAILVGGTIGTWAGVAKSRRLGNAIAAGSSLTLALPLFALALLLQVVFALWIPVLPPSGTGGLFSAEIILPAATAAIPSSGFIARFVYAAVSDHTGDAHVQTSIAFGASRGRVIHRDVLRVSLSPVISIAATDLSRLLGGVVMVEIIFGWAGVGRYAYQALLHRNLPAFQGALLLIALSVLMVNFLADLAYGWADPRVRRG